MLFGDQVIKLAIHMSGKDILKCNTKAIKTMPKHRLLMTKLNV